MKRFKKGEVSSWEEIEKMWLEPVSEEVKAKNKKRRESLDKKQIEAVKKKFGNAKVLYSPWELVSRNDVFSVFKRVKETPFPDYISTNIDIEYSFVNRVTGKNHHNVMSGYDGHIFTDYGIVVYGEQGIVFIGVNDIIVQE